MRVQRLVMRLFKIIGKAKDARADLQQRVTALENKADAGAATLADHEERIQALENPP